MNKTIAAHRKIRYSASDKRYYTVCYLLVSLVTIAVLIPMTYVISSSFSSPSAINGGKVWLWPVGFTLEGYRTVLQYQSVWIGYRNTIFYTVCGTIINITMTLICAYPLARKGLKGKTFFSLFFSFTMLFGGGMIPSYILMRNLGLINNVWGMLLPGAMAVNNMIIARTSIQSGIPEEMIEAAKLDGASDTQIFFRLVLPLSKAIIAVLALYYAVGHWNSYFHAMIYLNDRNLYPLQLFLRQILVQNTIDSSDITDPEIIAAMQGLIAQLKYPVIVVSTLPLFCLYPFVQKHFTKGVMIGSLKG